MPPQVTQTEVPRRLPGPMRRRLLKEQQQERGRLLRRHYRLEQQGATPGAATEWPGTANKAIPAAALAGTTAAER